MRGVVLRETENPKSPSQQACATVIWDLAIIPMFFSPCIPSFPGVSLTLRTNWQPVVQARLFQTLALQS